MYGFECRTQVNSELLISSEYPTLHRLSDAISYIGSVRLPLPGVFWSPVWDRYSIYYPFNTPPLPFINLDIGESAVIANITRSNNDWIFDVIAQTGSWGPSTYPTRLSASTVLSKLHCFGNRLSYSTVGNGLKVYAANGGVNFSSSDNPLWLTTFKEFTNVVITSSTYHSECTGSLNGSHTYPIFHPSTVYAQPFPFTESYGLVGWKRTGDTTYTSYRIEDSVPASATINTYILVADLVL